MRRLFPLIIVLLCGNSFVLGQKVVSQSDWHNGPGTLGVVTDWDNRFYISSNINYLYEYGRLSLTAEMNSHLTKHNISSQGGSIVQTGDINNDGKKDVIVGEGISGRVSWYENLGRGEFGEENVIFTSGYPCFCIGDVNKDGYSDIVTTNDKDVFFFRNISGTSFSSTNIGRCKNGDAIGIEDIDGDGDMDIMVSGWNSNSDFVWFENKEGTWIRHLIQSPMMGEEPGPLKISDLNGDGKVDVVINSQGRDLIEWWKQVESDTIKFEPYLILEDYDSYDHAFDWVVDMDKDGDNDIIATADMDNSIDWFENNGEGQFLRHNISSAYLRARSVVALDLEYDGDIDIVSASQGDGTLDWWENKGDETFERHTFATGYSEGYGVWVDDIDGNGFYDVVSTSFGLSSTDWWDLFDHFVSSGELESSILDVGIFAEWNSVEWDAELPSDNSVEVYVRTSNDHVHMGDWKGPISISGTNLSGMVEQYTRYIQYKIVLTTEDPDYSPLFYEIRFTYFGGDVGVDSIDIPVSEMEKGETVVPRVRVSNFLDIPSDDDCEVICHILKEEEVVYADTILIDAIAPGDEMWCDFTKSWTPEETGEYTVKSWTAHRNDQNSSNDMKIKEVTVKEEGVSSRFPSIREVEYLRELQAIRFRGFPAGVIIGIYSIEGRVVKKEVIQRSEEVIDFNVPSGIYFITDSEGNHLKTITVIR